MIPAEMLRVFGLQKRALVMVEPPRQQRRAGIFEVHDGVFIAVENPVLKRLRGFVRHPRVQELGSRMNAFPMKT